MKKTYYLYLDESSNFDTDLKNNEDLGRSCAQMTKKMKKLKVCV